jgi:hypothetical protein
MSALRGNSTKRPIDGGSPPHRATATALRVGTLCGGSLFWAGCTLRISWKRRLSDARIEFLRTSGIRRLRGGKFRISGAAFASRTRDPQRALAHDVTAAPGKLLGKNRIAVRKRTRKENPKDQGRDSGELGPFPFQPITGAVKDVHMHLLTPWLIFDSLRPKIAATH